MNITKSLNQTDLFKTLQSIRLRHEIKLVEENLYKNRPTTPSPDDGVLKKLWAPFGNEIKSGITQNLLNKKTVILREYDRFTKNINMTTGTIYNEKDVYSFAGEVFTDDIYLLKRTLFSISIIFDREYEYQYDKESLAYVSQLLWGNKDKLESIKSDIENIYKDLAKQPLSATQKFVLGGVAALTLFTAVAPALAVGGLSAAGITSSLATFGGTMVGGVGVIALAELLLDGAIIGFTYALLDAQRRIDVKHSFRKMSYDSAAQMLAIKCYIMHVAKQTMPAPLFKEKTSELLQMISDLKSDTDYVLFVEGKNVDENKKKIKVFHNLDNKLEKMFCI